MGSVGLAFCCIYRRLHDYMVRDSYDCIVNIKFQLFITIVGSVHYCCHNTMEEFFVNLASCNLVTDIFHLGKEILRHCHIAVEKQKLSGKRNG